MKVGFLVAILLCSMLVVPTGQAQVHQCGKVQLIFLNPDLQPGADGAIPASGNFFAQFQAIGAGSELIKTFGFSFGVHTNDFPETVCNEQGIYYSGQAIQNYRADRNPDDGFFINLQTALVPDGEYSAAVHAYDASDRELARFWARAVVNNCDGDLGSRCDGDAAQNQRQDKTAPWPIVLPGDGQKLDAVTGFSLEFPEELKTLDVRLNGLDISEELEPWEGRMWDDDLFPGYGPNGLGNILVPECSTQPPQECGPLGEAYVWNKRALTDDDVLRVVAIDLSGNQAVKDLHIGSGITGGALSADIPVIEWSVVEDEFETDAGKQVIFEFNLQNRGAATGHPYASQIIPDGWTSTWQPFHEPVPSGGKTQQKFIVTPPANATAGTYPITATMTYQVEGKDKVLSMPLKIMVLGNGNNEPTPDGPAKVPKKDSPIGSVLPLTALALAAIAMSRRNQH